MYSLHICVHILCIHVCAYVLYMLCVFFVYVTHIFCVCYTYFLHIYIPDISAFEILLNLNAYKIPNFEIKFSSQHNLSCSICHKLTLTGNQLISTLLYVFEKWELLFITFG